MEINGSESAMLNHAYSSRFFPLKFALTGLPPSAEQLQRAASGDIAPLIDELLASPQFGEYWGRHWLDLARFAESSGGGRTLLFKDAWRYRDYVIESINADVPLEAYHYNFWKQRDLREKSAWVTDLTFESRLDRPNWVIVDHHTSEAAP